MDTKNNQILATILKNKPLLIVILVVFVLIPLVLLIISLTNRQESFALKSVKPENGGSISPDGSNIIFEFNQEMLLVQKDTFSITIDPKVDFVYGILDNKLQINLSNLKLAGSQTYNVQINNILSRSNEVIRTIATSFSIELPQDSADFIDNLPYKGDGFTIYNISDKTLYVRVTKAPEKKYEKAVMDFLSKKGISGTKFNIDVRLPSNRNVYDDAGIKD